MLHKKILMNSVQPTGSNSKNTATASTGPGIATTALTEANTKPVKKVRLKT